jgi:glycosyltransferase involved in cell wall biosynthesis
MTGEQTRPAGPRHAPLVSVVTVTLNAGERLGRTVASVAEQTWRDLEHVIQDGGSRDRSTAAIVGDPRVRLMVAPDRGVYDAMNQALRRCRGRYVVFLNAGDCFSGPGALAAVAECMQGGSAELFYCDIQRADDASTFRYPSRLSRFFVYRHQLCHQACFFAASAYRRLGDFDLSFRLTADYDFLLRALVRDGMAACHVPQALVTYEGGGLSEMASNRAALEEEERRVRARHFTRWERLRYEVALAFTLRPLRVALFRHEALRSLRPLYQRVVNAWNQGSWRRG